MLLEFVIPIILIVGTVSNLLSFYVFTRPALKGLSTFRFLAYLSLIDFFYLVIGLPHILIIVYTDYDFRDFSDLVCSLHSFFTIYLSHVSSNVLAAVGVFRCVTLTTLKPIKPNMLNKNVLLQTNNNSNYSKMLKKNSLLTIQTEKQCRKLSNNPNSALEFFEINRKKKSFLKRFIAEFGNADIIVLVIMFVIFLFDCHYLIWMRLSPIDDDIQMNTTHSQENITIKMRCYPSIDHQYIYYHFYTSAYIWIDLFLYSYIPFAIMIICTVLIIFRLFLMNKKFLNTQKNDQLKKITINQNRYQENSVFKINPDSNSDLKMDENFNGNKQRYFKSKSEIEVIKKQKKTSNKNDLAKKRAKKNNQTYKLLLTLNIFFFVLVTPLVLSNSLGFLKEGNKIILELVYILAYLNHTINFIFYGLSCEVYRTILIDLIKNIFH